MLTGTSSCSRNGSWVSLRKPYQHVCDSSAQVIVKYAEIVVTPERPEYGGGVWHVEGMENEAICASCIAYLASDNITESRLHFRSMVTDPPYAQGGVALADSHCTYVEI